MGYKIKKSDKFESYNLWNIDLEIFVALFAKKLIDCRNITKKEALKVINELNFNYLRKKDKLNLSMKNYTATRLQREIIKGSGY